MFIRTVINGCLFLPEDLKIALYWCAGVGTVSVDAAAGKQTIFTPKCEEAAVCQ